MDIPYGVSYIAKLAYMLSGQQIPKPMKDIIENRIDSCHFEYEGSTHAIRTRIDKKENNIINHEIMIKNTDETANTGNRSLKVIAKNIECGEELYVYKKTYYTPSDFHDSRYDPSFSPVCYPGQTVCVSVCVPSYCSEYGLVQVYAHDSRKNILYKSEKYKVDSDKWNSLEYTIPYLEGALIDEIGVIFTSTSQGEFIGLIDDLYVKGKAKYKLNASYENEEIWYYLHKEISQFTRLKGLFFIEDDKIHLSCSDFAQAYTGHINWDDYECEFKFTPITGQHHYINFRVQGAIRSYAAGFYGDGTFALLKNDNGYKELVKKDYKWQCNKEYIVKIKVQSNNIIVYLDGEKLIEYADTQQPYLNGCIGLSVEKTSHCALSEIKVN